MMSEKMTWLVDQYLTAKETVLQRGYAAEIDWQTTASIDDVTEQEFLRETGWVILSSGMRETVVRKCFPGISAAFLNWTGAESIIDSKDVCAADALAIFGHHKKITAIVSLANRVCQLGIEEIRTRVKVEGPTFLQHFDYIGPVTCFHLAKNLGLDVVKPDRHLVRLAAATQRPSPLELCHEISMATGDRLAVVDLVLWRFASLFANYEETFSQQVVRHAA